MARRPHKKSRAGCLTCKRRHVKCDETRPNCIPCSTSHRECEYSESGSLTWATSSTPTAFQDNSASQSPAFAIQSSTGVSPDTSSGYGQRIDSPALAALSTTTSATFHASPDNTSLRQHPEILQAKDAALNLNHLELLHHFCTETYKTMSPLKEQQDTFQVCCSGRRFILTLILALALALALTLILTLTLILILTCSPHSQEYAGERRGAAFATAKYTLIVSYSTPSSSTDYPIHSCCTKSSLSPPSISPT